MLNFTFAQTLFLGIGAAFVVLSLLLCLLPRNRRFGVLSLLIANIFLWSSIVYCKNISNFLSGLGLSSELLTQDKLYLGITVGVGLFAIWFLLWTLVKKFLNKCFKNPNNQEQKQTSEQKLSSQQKNIHQASTTEKGKIENKEFVDPAIFKMIKEHKQD